jgi:hypothetical protein
MLFKSTAPCPLKHMASAHKTKCRLSSGRIALLPAHATDLCHVEACNVPVQARRNRAAAAKRTDEVISVRSYAPRMKSALCTSAPRSRCRRSSSPLMARWSGSQRRNEQSSSHSIYACAAARGRSLAAAGTFSLRSRSAVACVSLAISSGESAMRSRNFRPAIFGA